MSGSASGRPIARESRTTTSSRPGSSTQAAPVGTAEPRLSRVPVTTAPSGCSGLDSGRNAATVRMVADSAVPTADEPPRTSRPAIVEPCDVS